MCGPQELFGPQETLRTFQSTPVVAGSVGIVRATVPFHGEHDAPEPTKVKRGQGGGRASALAPEL